MAAKYVWGWGGVKFEVPSIGTADYTASFDYAPVGIAFTPDEAVYTTINGERVSLHKGWRANIKVLLTNACDTDYVEFVKLLNIINAGRRGLDVLCRPRHSTDATSLVYSVRLISGVDFASVAPSKTAQRLELEFESVSLVEVLPTLVSDAAWYYLTTTAGAHLVTAAGKYITVRG
jgi:hypothetical protein